MVCRFPGSRVLCGMDERPGGLKPRSLESRRADIPEPIFPRRGWDGSGCDEARAYGRVCWHNLQQVGLTPLRGCGAQRGPFRVL